MAKGTNTASVMTSCRILSWARLMAVKPMRLAGTCKRYSNSAMPQDTSAAIHHGLALRCFRCPYQAKVMKIFDAASNSAVGTMGWENQAVTVASAGAQKARIVNPPRAESGRFAYHACNRRQPT